MEHRSRPCLGRQLAGEIQIETETFYLPENWTEIELLPGLSLENIRATRLTWDAFHSFAWQKIVWMTPDVCVCNGYLPGMVLNLGANGTKLCAHATPDTADGAATATCDFAVRLVATCEQTDLYIEGADISVPPPLSGAAISLFFQESRSCLQTFEFNLMALSEDLCLALATMSRLDVELEVRYCRLADDAAGAFVECLQSYRGSVKLKMCKIGSQIIANALTGDSRVTRLKPDFDGRDDADTAILFRALANNRGLVNLDLQRYPISDENWAILCESLQAHPTLTCLNLIDTRPWSPTGITTLRTRLLTAMMQTNTVLHTITLSASERDGQICTEEIRPYLATNQYRPRVHAIKKTKDRPFREKVLGRVVYSVRRNPNLVWMLLSENVDAFVRSEEEEEESNSEVPVAVMAAVVAAGSKRKH
jgi:hypothetical protein